MVPLKKPSSFFSVQGKDEGYEICMLNLTTRRFAISVRRCGRSIGPTRIRISFRKRETVTSKPVTGRCT